MWPGEESSSAFARQTALDGGGGSGRGSLQPTCSHFLTLSPGGDYSAQRGNKHNYSRAYCERAGGGLAERQRSLAASPAESRQARAGTTREQPASAPKGTAGSLPP